MSKHRIQIVPQVDADVDEVATFIAQDRVSVALRFYDAVEQTFLQIYESPNRWPRYELNDPLLNDLRRKAVIRFPNCVAFYQTPEI